MNRNSLIVIVSAALLPTAICSHANPITAPMPVVTVQAPDATQPAKTPSSLQSPNTLTPNIDPAAKAIFEKMIATYAALKSFSENMDILGKGISLRATVHFKKPDKANIVATSQNITRRMDTDGKYFYITSSTNLKQYYKLPVRNGQNSINTLFYLAYQNHVVEFTELSLIGADLIGGLGTSFKKLELLPQSQIGDIKVDTIRLILGDPAGQQTQIMTFDIGHNDHLLHRITTQQDGAPPIVETHSNIDVNKDILDMQFAFAPPTGAQPVQPGQAPDQSIYDKRLKAGVNPFPFQAKDLDGKTVSLDQYRGKVLLLDFWATWCGPCNIEIPNVVATYQKYHDKGFDIVGVSMDQNPDKQKFQSFLTAHNMTWPQIFQQFDVVEKYGVQAIPFTLIVGKDGKISAVDVRGPLLEQAVQEAIAK